jgi:protein tyrosine/serine phosphatase
MGIFLRNTSVKVSSLTLFTALFLIAGSAFGQSDTVSSQKFPGIKIKNFGQMDERFYRGAQPEAEDYPALAALGIKIIFDLRNDPKDFARRAAEASGLRYVNIPMSDKERPDDAQISDFLRAVNESGDAPFYVHCRGGRHRTGVMGAVYRIEHYGWNYDKVYSEMKQYDYYSRWGHGDLKVYVQDYHAREQKENQPAITDSSDRLPK